MNDQTLQLVFGSRVGEHIRLGVLGQTCRNATDDWYRSQLNAEFHINAGTRHGYRSLVMFSDDFHIFRTQLKRLRSGKSSCATLETSDFLSIDICHDAGSYNIWMQLDALEENGEFVLLHGGDENWEWRLPMDRTAMDELNDAVTQVSDLYPTWSVRNTDST